jgi:hypothetical protein
VVRVAVPALAAAGLFAAYLRMSLTVWVNSDGATNALQAWDMWHGDPLLSGWRLTDVTFATIELPICALVEMVHGLNGLTVHLAAALVYTAVLFAACILAKAGTRGPRAAVRVGVTALILVAPAPGTATGVLLLSPDHFGTSLALLLILLLLDRRPTARPTPLWLAGGLAWAVVSDTTAVYLGVLPIAAVYAVRALRARLRATPAPAPARADALVALAAIAGYALGRLALWAISAAGGFTAARPATAVTAPGTWPHALSETGRTFLLLYGIDLTTPPHGWPLVAGWIVHAAGLLFLLAAIARCVIRMLRPTCTKRDGGNSGDGRNSGNSGNSGDRRDGRDGRDVPGPVDAVLLLAILINLAAFAFSTMVGTGVAAREISDTLPLGAALAGRSAGPLLTRLSSHAARTRVSALCVSTIGALLAVGAIATFGYGVSRPYSAPPSQAVAAWLASHGLRYGLADYWDAATVTAAAGNAVQVRPVEFDGPVARPPVWNYRAGWYDPAAFDAEFILVDPFRARDVNAAAAGLVYGPPAARYTVAGQEILVYRANLLAAVRTG